MKIVVINGTEIKGCTYHLKECFLNSLDGENTITEFYLPKDCPHFCCGCKICFFKNENLCPHAKYVMPIWNAILVADLLVFAYPVYALHTPGQVKALLDHLCCHWMVHRPEKVMFEKQAVILTQSIGAPNGTAQKDVATSLTWMGVSSIKTLGFGLMEGVIWEELSEKRKRQMELKIKKLALKYRNVKIVQKNLKVKMFFFMSKMMHKKILKTEKQISADNQHWIEQEWLVK